ncbi:transglutaminase family protein [Chthonobacter albigriseus]|uniref:transglutaminase family protein n=1 Tax=Chthonobacter albigriseus TaxID=1683161 RepID=UPI0015EF2281|nr:transglutaminase family protein [Chthonobacter albigriseus]
MTVYSVRHITTYHYSRPVSFGEHRILFRPRDSFDQHLLGSTLQVSPEPSEIRWIHDVFGNCITRVSIPGTSSILRFETTIRLDHTPLQVPNFRIDEDARTYPIAYTEDDRADFGRAADRHYPDQVDEVGQWARRFLRVGRPTETGALLMTLCFAIRESFVYARRTEAGTQPPDVTLRLRRGTCRDFALLMMEAVRSLGFAARFVTGYIYVPDRDGSVTLGGGSTHAWCQIYLPGSGWVEFDPTNGIVGNQDLIRVAVARDPRQAIPLTGSFHGYASDDLGMSVQVNVTTEKSGEERRLDGTDRARSR